MYSWGTQWALKLEIILGDFPGSPVAKTLCSQCRGLGSTLVKELDPTCCHQDPVQAKKIKLKKGKIILKHWPKFFLTCKSLFLFFFNS